MLDFKKIVRTAVAMIWGIGMVGCASTHQQNGTLLSKEAVKQVQVGKSTQQDVLRLLGTPSFISPIQQNVWYYVSRFSECCAFFTPRVLENKVYVLAFSPEGKLVSLVEKSKQDMKEVCVVKRETPPVGQSTPAMKQLFRNLGKAPSKPKRF